MDEGLTGKYFLVFEGSSKCVIAHGEILARVAQEPPVYLVKLFEAEERLVPVTQMVKEKWIFYATEGDWSDALALAQHQYETYVDQRRLSLN